MFAGHRPSPLHAAIEESADQYPPDIADRLVRLASSLPPVLAWDLLELIRAVDDDAHRSGMAMVDSEWPRVLAHVPGLAPVLDRVRCHAEQPQPDDCPACAAALGLPAGI